MVEVTEAPGGAVPGIQIGRECFIYVKNKSSNVSFLKKCFFGSEIFLLLAVFLLMLLNKCHVQMCENTCFGAAG